MITKDELDRLKEPAEQSTQLDYTIGGAVEREVHAEVEAERSQRLQSGSRIMNAAVEHFRNAMSFQSREGFAKAQFLGSNAPPPEDRALAEETWRDNHRSIHEEGFERVSSDLREQTSAAFKTDINHAPQANDLKSASRSEAVAEFAASMTNQQHQSNER